jgi:hypothetical protein
MVRQADSRPGCPGSGPFDGVGCSGGIGPLDDVILGWADEPIAVIAAARRIPDD